jgi:hypothetical protein
MSANETAVAERPGFAGCFKKDRSWLWPELDKPSYNRTLASMVFGMSGEDRTYLLGDLARRTELARIRHPGEAFLLKIVHQVERIEIRTPEPYPLGPFCGVVVSPAAGVTSPILVWPRELPFPVIEQRNPGLFSPYLIDRSIKPLIIIARSNCGIARHN